MEKKNNKFFGRFFKTALYLLVAYLVFLLAKSLWTNYDLKETVKQLENQISQLQEQKKELENLIVYYNSDAFKELEARKKLGLKRPDEKVLIVSNAPAPENFVKELEKERLGVTDKKTEINFPNYQLWWQYLIKN